MNMHTESRITQWAETVRTFERAAKDDAKATLPVRVWVIGPMRIVVGSIARYLVTVIAVILRPKIFYAIPPSEENPFLGHRAFVVGSIGLYELLGGQFVYSSSLEKVEPSIVKTGVTTAISAIGLVALVVYLALLFLVGARVARVPLEPPGAFRMAGYALGPIPILQLVAALPVLGALQIAPGPYSTGAEFLLVGLPAIGAAVYLIYATFIVPMRLLSPEVSTGRLWFAWLVGWFCTFLFMLLAMGLGVLPFLQDQQFKVGF